MSKNIIDLGVVSTNIMENVGVDSFTDALGSTKEGYQRIMLEAVTPAIEAEVKKDKDTVCRSAVYQGVLENMGKMEDVTDADKLVTIIIMAEHYEDLVSRIVVKDLMDSKDPGKRMMGMLTAVLSDIMESDDE